MEEEITVKSGDIDDHKLMELINAVWGSWGGLNFLEWVYHENPVTKEEDNFFAITEENGEKIVGFRRGGIKKIIDIRDPKTITALEYKHGSVHPDYQGMGIYSKISKSKPWLSKKKEHDFKLSFVRKTNIPFKMHQKEGWAFRVLPLYLYIISPKKVVEEYIRFFKEKEGPISSFIRVISKRMDLVLSDGTVDIYKMMGGDGSDGFKVPIHVSDKALNEIIEYLAEGGDVKELSKELSKLTFKGEINFISRKKLEPSGKKSSTIDKGGRTVVTIDISEKENPADSVDVEELGELYSCCLKKYDLSFRRDLEDIIHLLNYPYNTDIIMVRKDQKLVGFSCVGYAKEGKKELWVLDLVYDDEKTFDMIIEEIKKIGVSRGMNSIRLYSDKNPGEEWAHVPITTMMWDDRNEDKELERKFKKGKWKISQYDVF